MGYFRCLAPLGELLFSASTLGQPGCIVLATYGQAKGFLGTLASAGRRRW